MERVRGNICTSQKEVASFVLPIGAKRSIWMVPVCIGVSSLSLLPKPLEWNFIGLPTRIIATATLASIGLAAVPGAGNGPC